MEAAVLKKAAEGTIIFGICGGYQMLGETLSDPYKVENGGTMKGMGLLPIDTVFEGEKTRTRVSGNFRDLGGDLAGLSGTAVEGYEIHMGTSMLKEGARPLRRSETTPGPPMKILLWKAKRRSVQRKRIWHLRARRFRQRRRGGRAGAGCGSQKGIDTEHITGIDYQTFKETQYDILAEQLRKHMDMERIYRILEEGIA